VTRPGDRAGERKTVVFSCNSLLGLLNFRGRAIEALARDGHRVVLIAHADAPIDRAAVLGAEFVPWVLAARSVNPWREVLAVVALHRLYRTLRPDIAFHFTIKAVIYGALVARVLRVRCISVVTGTGYLFLTRPWRKRVAVLLYRLAIRRSHEVWFLNDDDRALFAAARITTGLSVRTLPGEGVELERFARSPLPDSSKRFVFLMIARLVKDKGVVEFAEAAGEVRSRDPRATFRLLGPHYPAKEMSIAPAVVETWSSAGWLEYLGATDDVRPAIDTCHCVVLPSYGEGMPRVLMEAAAMGRPQIATDVPGCRDIVIDGTTGFLCKPRSADALAEACMRMLSLDRTDTEAMAYRAHCSAVERFDDRIVIAMYRDLVAQA
jgi:glycosyltransferase involved in cell wall biosynthesis